MPINAVYQQQDERTIRWDLAEAENLQTACEDFSQGLIMATLSSQQTPDSIFYMIDDNEMVAKSPSFHNKMHMKHW